jgi:hypothetical protein
VPGTLVPEDDLYARLEVAIDASPEAIELAWRALLKRHHPDVAGDDVAALERAKRINVAHDWLADPRLRARYDRERLAHRPAGGRSGAAWGRTGVRHGRPPRGAFDWARQRPAGGAAAASAAAGTASARTAAARSASAGATSPRVARRPDLVPGDPAQRLARFLDDVGRLTPDELDRLAAADPPPIAFLATIRRFVPDAARASFEDAEARLAARVPRNRWASVGLREGLLGVTAELVLAGFLDETLDEPFRSRARDRLLRAWQASVAQPRYGPNGAEVLALRARLTALRAPALAAVIRASHGVPGDDRPWPAALDRDEDEALRISAALAAGDLAAAVPDVELAPSMLGRARRLAGRLGHVVALRHAYPPATYAALVAPWASVLGDLPGGAGRAPGPGVRRAR